MSTSPNVVDRALCTLPTELEMDFKPSNAIHFYLEQYAFSFQPLFQFLHSYHIYDLTFTCNDHHILRYPRHPCLPNQLGYSITTKTKQNKSLIPKNPHKMLRPIRTRSRILPPSSSPRRRTFVVDSFDVVAQGIEDEGGVIRLRKLGSEPGFPIADAARLSVYEARKSRQHHVTTNSFQADPLKKKQTQSNLPNGAVTNQPCLRHVIDDQDMMPR